MYEVGLFYEPQRVACCRISDGAFESCRYRTDSPIANISPTISQHPCIYHPIENNVGAKIEYYNHITHRYYDS
jgi:hypothetical protein